MRRRRRRVSSIFPSSSSKLITHHVGKSILPLSKYTLLLLEIPLGPLEILFSSLEIPPNPFDLELQSESVVRMRLSELSRSLLDGFQIAIPRGKTTSDLLEFGGETIDALSQTKERERSALGRDLAERREERREREKPKLTASLSCSNLLQ